MGRRSTHTPEELRQLILGASKEVVETDGLLGFSAREIARKIGYSPGTIYNVFHDLDDVLETLQMQLLDEAAAHLDAIAPNSDPHSRLKDLARAYVGFALDNRRLWNLLFQHQPAARANSKNLHEGVNKIMAKVTSAVADILKSENSAKVDGTARTLWAGVHGISAIAVTNKGPTMTPETAQAYAEALTETYVKGLRAR